MADMINARGKTSDVEDEETEAEEMKTVTNQSIDLWSCRPCCCHEVLPFVTYGKLNYKTFQQTNKKRNIIRKKPFY